MSKVLATHLPEVCIRRRQQQVDDDVIAGWEHYYRSFALDTLSQGIRFVQKNIEAVPSRISQAVGRIGLLFHEGEPVSTVELADECATLVHSDLLDQKTHY